MRETPNTQRNDRMTTSVFQRFAFAALLATLWAGPAPETQAAMRTLRTGLSYPWINDGAASNWVEGVFPVAADDVVLNGSGQWGGFFSPTYKSLAFYNMAACYTGGTINVTTNFTLHSGTTCGWGDQAHGLNVTGNISIGATGGAHLFGFATTTVGGNVTVGTAAPSTWTLANGNATVGGALNLGTSAASYGNLNLNNRALTVPVLNGNGGTIFFQTTSQMTLTGGASTLGAATAVNGAGVLNLSSAATNLTIDASAAYPFPIVISGPGRIVKTGVGALNLSAANTYTGTTSVNGGTVSLATWNVDASNGAWGKSTGAIQMAGGGADYTGPSASGMLRSVNLLSGSNTFNIVNAGTKLNFNGAQNRFQSTGGSLVKTGAGTLQLGDVGIYNSAFTGKVTVNAGTLEWWAGSSMPTPAALVPDFLTLNNGGTLGLSFTGASTVSANLGMKLSGTATITAAGSHTIAGVIGNGASAGGFAKTGTGTLTLSGYNTYTGLTTVNAGTLTMANASGTLRPNNNITVNSGGTLTTIPGTLSNFVYGAEATGTGNITLNSGGKANTGNGAAITFRGQNFILNGGELASGTPSTAWGSWILDEGSAVTANTSSVISASNLNLRAANTNFTVASGQTLSVTGTLTTSNGGGTPSGTNGGLTKLGAGTMNLSGANTYKGATTVAAGTLVLSTANQTSYVGGQLNINGPSTLLIDGTAGVRQYIFPTTTWNFDSTGGGTLNSTAGTNWVVGGTWTFKTNGGARNQVTAPGFNLNLATTNNAVLNVAAGTDAASDLDVAAAITNGAGSLTKSGNGTARLTGANGYTGITTVSAGKLLVNGNQAAATGAVSVASGATLGGSGTLGGTVTVNSGGTLAPGNSPGVITMAGLSLPTGAILAMELGQAGVVGGTFNDRVQVNGNLTLGGGTVNVTVPTTPAGTFTPGTYRLIDYTGTLTNSGGLVVGTLPAGFSAANMYIDVNTTAKQVNLVVRDATYVNWDVTPKNNGVVNGGTGTWTAGVSGGSTNWTSTAGTFNSGWNSGSTAVFGGTAGTVTVDTALGAVSIGGLTFNTTGYTVAGGTLTGGSATNTLTAGTGISGTISSVLAGSGGFTKSGAGTVSLNALNTYTGTTTIDAGTLVGTIENSMPRNGDVVINNGGTLTAGGGHIWGTPAGTGTTTVNGGGVLTTNDGQQIVIVGRPLVLNGGTLASGLPEASFGSWRLGAPVSVTANSSITASGVSVSAASVFTINPGITLTASSTLRDDFYGVGTLVKAGTGVMTLSGANAFTGATTVNAGTLQVGSGGTVGSITGTSPVSIASGATLAFYRSDASFVIPNASSGAGTLRFKGTGTTNQSGYDLTGTASTLSGAVIVESGARITASSSIGTAPITISPGATLMLPSGTMGNAVTIAGTGWTETLGNLGALRMFGSAVLSGNVTLSANARIGLYSASDMATISGVISGAFAMEKAGAGTLTVSGINTYTGTTTVSTGTLTAGAISALSGASAITVNTGATLNINGTTQSVPGVTGTGTVALGAAGKLTLKTGPSSIGAITGTGTITVNTGATLTLTTALVNTGINIVLNGGTLNLGSLTHSIGALTINANSTLDFSSAGNAQLTTTSLTLSASNTLAVTNWTQTSDRFYATAFVGATRNTAGASPMNRITLGSGAAGMTVWKSDSEVTLQLDPKLRISKTSNGGVGSFVFQLTGLSAANDSIATVTSGVAVQGVGTLKGTQGVAVTIAESGVPAGWPANPLSASCVDTNGTNNANGSAAFGTLAGNTLTITAARMLQGADIACSFVNTLNAISGTVFNDGGAPSAGVNTGIPNDGLQNGGEPGLAGVVMRLSNCASITHASATTDSAGRYALSAPIAVVGQTVCVQPTLVAGRRPTGANVESTVTPDGGTVIVGGTAFVYDRATSRQSFIEPASGTRTLNFGLVPESTLAANSSKTAAAGAAALHAHTFVAGTGGSVSFASGTSTATPPIAGWNEVLYLNPGCATSLPPGATKLSPPSVAQSVVQGQTLCFFVQSFVPAGAVNGSSNSVPVIATMTFTNASPMLTASYTVTDVTTAGDSALSLQKEVRNITAGGAWGTSNQAKSGDTLEYRITYLNPSAAQLSTVAITDGTNLYTTFMNATASAAPPALGNCTLHTPNNPSPAPGVACTPLRTGSGKGTVRWEFSGTLAPGATGTVSYSVTVD